MSFLPLSPGLQPVDALVAALLCCGICQGRESDVKEQPAATKPGFSQKFLPAQNCPPPDQRLSFEAMAERVKVMSGIRVRGCTAADLTLKGLARVINEHLAKGGLPERMLLAAGQDTDVEDEVKTHFFGPIYQRPEPMDKEHLVKQINSGSVADLLMHLPWLCGTGMDWYNDGIRITESHLDVTKLGYSRWYDVRVVQTRPKQDK